MKKLSILFALFFIWLNSSAQLSESPYYERDTTSKYTVGLNTKFLHFSSLLSYNDKQVRYNNVAQSIGVRVRYKGLALVLGVVNFPYASDRRRPASSLNVVLRFYPKGLYIKSDFSYLSTDYGLVDYLRNFRETINDDVSIWNVDLYSMYQLNGNKINLQSFLAFRGKQLRSTGTWTINGYMKSSLVGTGGAAADSISALIQARAEDLLAFRIGMGAGYMQALNLTPNISFVAMLSFAPEFLVSRVVSRSNAENEIDFVFNLKPHGIAALVWNKGHYYSGLQFEYFPDVASSLETNYTFEYYSLRLSAGYQW